MMKTKKFLPFIIGLLMSISLVFVINNNQNQEVNAAVFRKVSVPKKFRGTWYGYDYTGKLKGFKITRSRIVLAGYTALNRRVRTYKYTKKAHDSHNRKDYLYQLIRTKGNRMRMSFPYGETAAAYVTKNRKKLYVGIDTWVDTYYKSKSAARKHHRADKKKGREYKLFKFVWKY